MTTTPAATFEPVDFAQLPGWDADDQLAALHAYLVSCGKVLAAVKAGNPTGRTPPTPEFLSACHDAGRVAVSVRTRLAARAFFEANFAPHRVVHDKSAGLLTGYYEPLLAGSLSPDARFKVPIYRRPPDLVNVVEETQRGARSDGLTHVRMTAAGPVPYPTRAEIESGALQGKGLELLYLEDPVDAFFMQIQGSGRIRLTDGSTIRISYDGKNGHPYTSIGRHLIDTGQLAADRMSLDALGRWLRTDPERGRKVMWRNASFVFFRELKGAEAKSAMGALEIPLTPGRSLAVDTSFHTLGTPVYVSAPSIMHALHHGPFQRLMIAQDVGSAIKGPERGDIYFGSGNAAGRLAGVTKHPGNFFVLLPRGDRAAQATAPAGGLPSGKTRQARQ